jgi:hypothetical protein
MKKKKIGWLLGISLLAFSCSSKDSQFCACLAAGKKLNDYSRTLFDKVITTEVEQEMRGLKSIKRKACKNYQKMAGPKMIAMKKNCEME